jgi:hypothetical protein
MVVSCVMTAEEVHPAVENAVALNMSKNMRRGALAKEAGEPTLAFSLSTKAGMKTAELVQDAEAGVTGAAITI